MDEMSQQSMEAIERFHERLGYRGDELPQEEKMSSRRIRRQSKTMSPKIHRTSTTHINQLLLMDEVFEGQGVPAFRVERAQHSLSQIMDILQFSGETALYSVIESPAQT